MQTQITKKAEYIIKEKEIYRDIQHDTDYQSYSEPEEQTELAHISIIIQVVK